MIIVKLKIVFGEEIRENVLIQQRIRTPAQLPDAMLTPKIPTGSLALFRHEFSTKLRNSMLITDGYVDSTGFHIGNEPDINKSGPSV
jgi:hypothetical protein